MYPSIHEFEALLKRVERLEKLAQIFNDLIRIARSGSVCPSLSHEAEALLKQIEKP